MTIRNRLTLRFTGLVTSILLLAFVSIYAFCWYFIALDFYRRLDRKAHTIGDMLIQHRLDTDLIHQINRIRKDQLPNQQIMVFDRRDSLIFVTSDSMPVPIPASLLANIRRKDQVDFRQGDFYVSGSRYMTADGPLVVVASAEDTYGNTFLQNFLWALVGLLGLIVGITAFAGWVFAGDALGPMQQIDQTLAHIFPTNRDERLPVSGEDDEISRLSGTINQLLDRVGESFQLQRMFMANVSHELKNPLTKIHSQLEVSLLNQRDADVYRKTIRSVLDDVDKLSTLTHELLQLSRVSQTDTSQVVTDRVRIDELIWDIRDEVEAIQPRYHVTVDLGVLPDEPELLAIAGNQTLLATAFKNLLENACKYSDDGQARVGVQFGPEQVQVEIQNQGTLIPADDIPYLFEPFFRSRQTAEVRGYGIGLPLVDQIVRLHRGTITVESKNDTLTVFTVELPRQPPL